MHLLYISIENIRFPDLMEAIIGSPALTVVENDVAVSILNLESAKKP